jgi:predicted N-acetyltransferase YhbS
VSPWLAGLFVAPEFRGLGIAAELVRTCERGAAALGAPALYLQTEIPGFYARLGWREYAREHYLGDDVVVMARDLP